MYNKETDSILYLGREPRLIKNTIIEDIPKTSMIQIQAEGDKYLRLKLTPFPEDKVIEELKRKYRVETKTYLSDDGAGIIEINYPRFDIICTRDTTRFPTYIGWILQVVEYQKYSDEVNVIATLKYNKDNPYALMIAEHLIEYLNMNKDELPTEYTEIYTY